MGIAGAAKACGGVDLAAVVVAPAIFPLLGGASLSATVACCCSSMLLSAKAPVVLDVVGAVVGLAADVAIPCCCCWRSLVFVCTLTLVRCFLGGYKSNARSTYLKIQLHTDTKMRTARLLVLVLALFFAPGLLEAIGYDHSSQTHRHTDRARDVPVEHRIDHTWPPSLENASILFVTPWHTPCKDFEVQEALTLPIWTNVDALFESAAEGMSNTGYSKACYPYYALGYGVCFSCKQIHY